MPQISIEFSQSQLNSVADRLKGIPSGVGKALAGAVNDTAKQCKTRISSGIRDKVNLKKKDIDPEIVIYPLATEKKPSAKVTLSKSQRLGLNDFGARPTNAGVTYQILKGGGRKLAKSAFGLDMPRLGGQVFRRAGAVGGKLVPRLPIVKLKGPSPWGVFVKSGMVTPIKAETQQLLNKNLEQRVRYLVLKANGAI